MKFIHIVIEGLHVRRENFTVTGTSGNLCEPLGNLWQPLGNRDPEPSKERVGDWGGPATVWSLLCVAETRATRPNERRVGV